MLNVTIFGKNYRKITIKIGQSSGYDIMSSVGDWGLIILIIVPLRDGNIT